MSQRRRFAIVTPNFHPRVCGVGDFSTRFASELLRREHEVAIFSRNPVERHPAAPEVEAHGVEGRLPIVIAHRVGEAIAKYRPTDVLLQYTSQMWDASRFGSPASLAVAWKARQAGARVTLVAHELFLPFASRPDLALAATLQRVQLAALIRLCDRVFVTTSTRAKLLGELCTLLGVHAPGVVRVGANAMPVPRRRPVDPSLPRRFGIFSTAANGKRFDVVLDAFERITREYPTAELVLIGDLGEPHRPLVRQVVESVARHPARDRIRLTGKLSLRGVAEEIADLDVYLFPMSTGANTRSSTLPTPLGSGLPTIATRDIETDLELFRDGENIVFAREMSGPAFAEATLHLLHDPSLMARVADGARRLYDDHLSWAGIVDRFLTAR